MTAPEIKKLNAMRFLEAHGATYETHTYDEGITDGIGAAQAMGFPPSQVYKTLVVQLKDNEHALVMIAADQELDLKRFAKSIGQKKATMPTRRGAEMATGLRTGGIGALALTHKRWGVYLDDAARQHETILVNAGQRGVTVQVKVDDLVRALNAKLLTLSASDAEAAASE
ncbi:MAG: aminoacyl-tRNA deacylase [Anaerolineae bacterium]|nr:aminoacyl-tRNA deacylase [Anaerolineae bacterium]